MTLLIMDDIYLIKSSESHMILIFQMTFRSAANDFRTPQKICIFANSFVGKRACDVPVTQRHGNYISGKS